MGIHSNIIALMLSLADNVLTVRVAMQWLRFAFEFSASGSVGNFNHVYTDDMQGIIFKPIA